MSSEDHSKLFVRSKAGPFSAHTMYFRPTFFHHLILECLTDSFRIDHNKKKENRGVWNLSRTLSYFQYCNSVLV